MAKTYKSLNDSLKDFIEEQKIFFVASSSEKGDVNLSPKGYSTFRVLGDNKVCYLDYPGSGNETASHIEEGRNVTLMFCSFTEKPMILKLFGKGEVAGKESEGFREYMSLFEGNDFNAVRQIIIVNIDSVMTSCGYGVPFFDYRGDRDQLREWSSKKAKEGTLGKYMGKIKGVVS